MILLTPLGLLGLIGIIALIIIYILKPKYQDKTLSSTFIWKLSLKYKKQRIPLEWLKSSLIFILQVAIITIMTIIMTNPNIVLETDSGEKIVILDASASMLAEDHGETRFERAIKEIYTLIDSTTPKDRFSVILAGERASFVVRRSDSSEFIKANISALQSQYGTSNIDDAMELAATILEENPTALIYYYTSQDFVDSGDVIIKNMSKSEWNAAILDVKAVLQTNNRYAFEATVASYGKAAEFAVQLKVNGIYRGATLANIAKDQTQTITWESYTPLSYDDLEVSIEVDDSFIYDNTYSLYGGNVGEFRIQLISDGEDEYESTLYFVKQALTAVNSRFIIHQPSEVEDYKESGYDLYIYNGYVPSTLPIDGAIWFFNPKMIPTGTGLTLNSEVTGNFNVSPQGSSSDTYRKVMKSIQPNNITVSKYVKFQSYPQFERILNIGSDPVLLTKNHNGVKITVFAFDLAYTNLPVLVNFPLMINNLVDYSLIPTFNKYLYNIGDQVFLNAKPSAQTMVVTSRDQSYLIDDLPNSMELNLPGVYTVTQTLIGGAPINESFFVRVPVNESRFNLVGDAIMMPLVPDGNDVDYQSVDLMDILPYLAGLLLAFILVEWVVQYREQY